MPLSALAGSSSRTVPYNGYDYVCYAQCGPATAYASTATDDSSTTVRVYAAAYNNTQYVQDCESYYQTSMADAYFSSLATHTKLVSEHYVSGPDGIIRLVTLTTLC